MAIPPKKLATAQLQSILTTLQRATAAQKKSPIALELAMKFNETLGEVGKTFPEIAGALPKPLNTRGIAANLGLASASFLDLEILCEQTLNLLGLVED